MPSDAVLEIKVGAPYVFGEIPKKTVVFEFFSSDDPASQGFFVKVGDNDVMTVVEGNDTWRKTTNYRHNILPTRELMVRAVDIELLCEDGNAVNKLLPFHELAIVILESHEEDPTRFFLRLPTMQLAIADALTYCYVPTKVRPRVVEALMIMAKNCDRRENHISAAACAIIKLGGVDVVDQFCNQFGRNSWRGRLWEVVQGRLGIQENISESGKTVLA